MKTTIKVEKEVEIKLVFISVPVRYEEEDMHNNFPMRNGDMWTAYIDIDTGIIEGWPQGETGGFFMKVTDSGVYKLIDIDGDCVAEINQNYVPNGLIPGEYGDYIDFKIDGSGKITNWYSNPSIEEFFNNDDDY